jgi:hypothetical protein
MASEGGGRGVQREQISPELVLVDPELAQRARERLSAEPFPAVEARRPTAAPTRPRSARSGRGRARLRRAVAALVALGAVAAVGVVATGMPSSVTRWFRGDGRDAAPAATRAEKTTPASSATTNPRRPHTKGRAAGSPAPPPQHVRRRQRPARGRVFAWPRTAGTAFYLVEFFKRGKKIYEARPSAPRLTLPRQWTFKGRRYRLAPGRYDWEVRAFSGPRSNPSSAKVIVSAKLQIRRQTRG